LSQAFDKVFVAYDTKYFMPHFEIAVSDPQADIITSTAQLGLFMAGQGSGKSFVIGVETGDFIKHYPYLVLIIAANTHGQLSGSTLKEVFGVWAAIYGFHQWNPKKKTGNYIVGKIPPDHFKIFGEPLKTYDNVISFDNGALIFTASLENYSALDGVNAFGAWLDETKDTKEEAVKEVVAGRLRQPGLWIDETGELYDQADYDHYFGRQEWQIRKLKNGERVLWDYTTNSRIYSYNPLKIYTSPAKVDWLNTWFGLTDMYEEISKRIFSKTDYFKYEDRHKVIVISSTYHNEDNLSVDFISNKLEQFKANQNLIDMNIFGSPIAKSGGEFVHQFKRLQHVKKVDFRKGYPVHLSLDFNVAPYMTGINAQFIPGKDSEDGRGKLRLFREYCLKSPRNKTEEIGTALVQEYGPRMDEGLFYYGDPGGKKRQTLSKEFENEFDALRKPLMKYLHNTSDRVLFAYPAVKKSRNFLNSLFAGVYPIDIEIDESLKNLIHDLEYAKEDENGAMLKERVKDPVTKQTYEKLGHCLDALRYMICALFPDLYEKAA
jgi:hypothetical protein